MKSLYLFGLAAATSVASSAAAGLMPGDMVTMYRVGVSPGRAIEYNYDSNRAFDGMVSGQSTFAIAGVNNFSSQPGGGGGLWQTFCVEMNEGFPDDPITYDVVEISEVPEHMPPGNMTIAKQELMRDLYARHYTSVINGSAGSFTDQSDRAAAFQLVIWEISHENLTSETNGLAVIGELNISEGAMAFTNTFSSAVADMANEMIASLGEGGNLRGFTSLFGLSNASNQDMLIVVPSPAVIGLAGLGLVGLRRRRR